MTNENNYFDLFCLGVDNSAFPVDQHDNRSVQKPMSTSPIFLILGLILTPLSLFEGSHLAFLTK